ncbi:MAG: hypothetical protein ACRC2T_00575 [Thermoguttaceae bacterium]
MSVPQSKAKKSYFNSLTLLVIAGLVLVNFAFFMGDSSNSSMTAKLFWHYLNPFHWPTWYAVNLWIIFIGITSVQILKSPKTQSRIKAFYDSNFWKKSVFTLKTSKLNITIVTFLMRYKITRWLLRKWVSFGKSINVSSYPVYAKWGFVFVVFWVFFRCSDIMASPRWYTHYGMVYLYNFPINWIYRPLYYDPLCRFMYNGTISWQLFMVPLTGLLLIIWLLKFNSTHKKKMEKSDVKRS